MSTEIINQVSKIKSDIFLKTEESLAGLWKDSRVQHWIYLLPSFPSFIYRLCEANQYSVCPGLDSVFTALQVCPKAKYSRLSIVCDLFFVFNKALFNYVFKVLYKWRFALLIIIISQTIKPSCIILKMKKTTTKLINLEEKHSA